MDERVLLVEDDSSIREVAALGLTKAGFAVTTAPDGRQGLLEFRQGSFDLVVLDVMLPGLDGFEVCRRLRAAGIDTPILMVTARDGVADRVAGLDLGADDYITKPFSVKELLARVRAVLRRTDESAAPRYEDDRLEIDFADMRAACDGQQVRLTRKEFALLEMLSKSAGRVATRQQILDNVWGYEYYGDTRTLDVHIRRLRQKLGACGDCIETVVGVGYRFVGCTKATTDEE